MGKYLLILFICVITLGCTSTSKKEKIIVTANKEIRFYPSGRVKEYILQKNQDKVEIFMFDDYDFSDKYYDGIWRSIDYDRKTDSKAFERKVEILRIYLEREELKDNKNKKDLERIKKYRSKLESIKM